MNLWAVKALAAVVLLPLWLSPARRRLERVIGRWPASPIVAVFALSRVLPCILAMVVLQMKYPQDAVEWGGIVTGAIAVSPYAAGFDLVLGLLWRIAPSPLTFVLAMIAAEVAAFALFRRIAVAHASRELATSLVVFWLVNPLSLFHIALNGQDESLILLTWCVVLWASLGKPAAMAGILGALGLFFTKIVGGIACLPLLVLPRRSIRTAARALAVTLLAGVALLAAAGTPLFGFIDELHYLTSGNVWALPEILGLPFTRTAFLECLVAAVGVAAVALRIRDVPLMGAFEQSLRVTGAVGATFMLLSPKSPTAWLVMFLPGVLFLIATAEGWQRRFLLAAFLPVTAFEPSIWFRLGQGALLKAENWGRPTMLVLDGVLLAGYVMVIRRGLSLRDPS